MCRVVNHMWERQGLERQGRDFILTLVCSSCGTERLDVVDLRSGEVERRYRYPVDYQLKLEDGETRPYKSDYRREWIRTLWQEETGHVIRLPRAEVIPIKKKSRARKRRSA